MRRLVIAGALLAISAVCLAASILVHPGEPIPWLVGQPCPNWQVRGSEEETISALPSVLLGRTSIVVLASARCKACEQLYPELGQLLSRHPEVDGLLIWLRRDAQAIQATKAVLPDTVTHWVLEKPAKPRVVFPVILLVSQDRTVIFDQRGMSFEVLSLVEDSLAEHPAETEGSDTP